MRKLQRIFASLVFLCVFAVGQCPQLTNQVITVNGNNVAAIGIQQGAGISLVIVGSQGDTLPNNQSVFTGALGDWTSMPGSSVTLSGTSTTIFAGDPTNPAGSGWQGTATNPVIKIDLGDPTSLCGRVTDACTFIKIDPQGHTIGALVVVDINATPDPTYLRKLFVHEDGHVYGFNDCSNCANTAMNPNITQTTITSCDEQYSYRDSGGAYGTWGCQGACDYYCVNFDPNICGDDTDATCGLPQATYDEWEAECAENGGVILDCQCSFASPIIIDVSGGGFDLTGLQGGVQFPITNTLTIYQVSWTAPSSRNAFLVLDRNGDGLINSGAELFGNFTAQPSSSEKNGFLALAEFDKAENGGNGDGVIDQSDAIFSKLSLWIDSNHDGISQANELYPLPLLGVYSIELAFKESRHTDQYGNQFRYRAKINKGFHSDDGKWAYDVIFKVKSMKGANQSFAPRKRKATPIFALGSSTSFKRTLAQFVNAGRPDNTASRCK